MNPSNSHVDPSKLSEQLLNVIQASEQLAYAVISPDFIILDISPNLSSIVHEPELEQMIGEPLNTLFGEFVGAESGLKNVLAGDEKTYLLERIARKLPDGSFFYLTLQLFLLDPHKAEAGLLLTVEDSTEIGHLHQRLTQQRNELKHEIARREKAEKALQQLNEELEQRVQERTAELAKANEQLRLLEAAIVNTSDTVIITQSQPTNLDEAGIVYVNKAFTKATGYTYKEIVGQSRQVFHGPNTDPSQLEKIRNALLNQEAVQVELINYRKDGTEFWVDMTVAPILNEKNELTHFVSIERDATERKQLETALLQAQKMEAVGLLAGGIAHDFNNVLTVILSYSDLILRKFHDDPTLIKFVKPIHLAGKRASDLTYQLLAFSRQQVFQLEEVNLNEIVTEVETMIRRPIGEDIQFTTLLEPDLWHIDADPGQLSQVIMNLSVNARDAMPKGGMLTIETKNIVLEETDSHISPKLDAGEYVKLTVSDTGQGMDNEMVLRIFDPFFTTKEIGKGTGLGLSTVYGIVAQSKGGIIVHSEPGAGTTFEIFLPRTLPERAGKQIQANNQKQVSKGRETILLVEDDISVRELVENGLKEHGYKVLVASDGQKALVTCRKHDGPINLLLTDVIMPNMNGHELAQQIKTMFPKIKILYMTGYTDTVLNKHGIPDDVIEILRKPFTIGQMINKVYRLLTHSD